MSKRSLQRRPTELPTPPRGRSARSLYNTSSAQPATLSLNVQSFQSTTFNGGRRIYGYHPLTSRTPFASSARPFSLPSYFLLLFRRPATASTDRSSCSEKCRNRIPRIGCARRPKQFYGSVMVSKNFICPRSVIYGDHHKWHSQDSRNRTYEILGFLSI